MKRKIVGGKAPRGEADISLDDTVPTGSPASADVTSHGSSNKSSDNPDKEDKTHSASNDEEVNDVTSSASDRIDKRKRHNALALRGHEGGLVSCGPGEVDHRVNDVSVIPKDSIVPHADMLKRIRTNYKLKELSEEDYVGCLETIIERDYFPELVRLRLTNALMEAETKGDDETAALVRKRLEQYDHDRDMHVQLTTLGNEKVSLNLGKGGLTLDEFSRIFTSEDNRSFGKLMEQAIIRTNKRNHWMEEGERKHNLAISNIQKNTNLGIKDKDVLSNAYVSRNALFFGQPENTSSKGTKCTIRTANTSMPSDHGDRMEQLNHKQKMKRTGKVKQDYYDKVNDLISQYGLRECKELLEDEQKVMYDFVSTPLLASSGKKEYTVPQPVTREAIADRLLKKYNASSSKTPIPGTPTCRTPLLVQNLIAKHKQGADLQLRKSYSSAKYSRGSTRSSVISHNK
ncbi:hypothetical protein BgAZ_203060 [Babesia gibsoni]|uniref:Uncharacterized protein n=1 Tax=Babesia gibsoni TaxID=33632 RepID=A0AAD8P9D2_BABGI|nr:hypothetical protein BgAZ_203060 [Babesia gibsoni]